MNYIVAKLNYKFFLQTATFSEYSGLGGSSAIEYSCFKGSSANIRTYHLQE